MQQKNNYWQFIRGICILAVIMIHCPSGAGYETSSLTFHSWLAFRQFINFPVATFVFLSGFFTNMNRVQDNYTGYLAKRGGAFISTISPLVVAV